MDGLVSVRQSWYADSRYNRLEVPRRFHGFFLLTDYPAVFELPDGGRMQATAGDVVLLPKGAHYALSLAVPDGKTAHPYIVNFRLSTPDGGEQLLGDRVLRLCRDEGALLPLFTEAAQLYKKAATAGLKAKVYQLFDTLFPIMQVDECCIAYINRHYTNRFSVPELAQRCAMSETVYRKRFRQLTGLSPVQYINRLKIEKACQMLRSDDISPGAISDFLNFYSLPYFYKVFRDYMGMTPNQYRDQDGAVQP
ncbi:MAG: AraC family transcriptional regulator [Oscillospiraceae bacterium]|nr:AraC family transcriptional regulator [Oscillospiraceae bacterium]